MEQYKKFGRSDILILVAMLLWAVNFSIVKISLREFSPFGFNGIRLFLASLILTAILVLKEGGFIFKKQIFWKLVFLGLIGNTVYQLLFIHGLHFSTASNTAIIIGLTPVFIALLSSILKHERLNVATWIGIIISFLGFYFVISRQPGLLKFSLGSLGGDLLVLAASMCWAVFTVLSKPLLEIMSPLKLTAITMVIGTIFYLPFCVKDIIALPYGDI